MEKQQQQHIYKKKTHEREMEYKGEFGNEKKNKE